jgi:hypothetical protein
MRGKLAVLQPCNTAISVFILQIPFKIENRLRILSGNCYILEYEIKEFCNRILNCGGRKNSPHDTSNAITAESFCIF